MRYPAFVIVGTPRSGTTLIQRVAAELDGVRIPPETHFFTEFVWAVHRRWRPDLEGPALREVLELYRNRPYMRGVPLDVDAVDAALGGRSRSVVDLYAAIVTTLAEDAPVVAEKTPGHLLWWRPLTRAMPDLKVVCVVRDPRAVVASFREVGWHAHPATTAARWCHDIRRSRAALRSLGPGRCLFLRFEDVVKDPDRARSAIGDLVGVGATSSLCGPTSAGSQTALFADWETWKAEAVGEVDPGRIEAWRQELEPRVQTQVAAICHRDMAELGYDDGIGSWSSRVQRLALSPATQLRRVRQAARRRRRDAGIARISRGWVPVVG